MESDGELPEDEEEILVYVEFGGTVSNSTFTKEDLQLDIIGIDTDHPIMQINGRFYEGTYVDAIGTYMFFEKDDNPVIDDPIFDQIPGYKYFAKTRKVLKMQRVFVKQRTEVLGDSDHQKCIPNIDTIKEAGVAPKYQDEALSFWKNIRDERISALNAYLEKQRIREEKKSQGIVPESESDEDNPFAIYKYKEEEKNINDQENVAKECSTKIPYLSDDILKSTVVEQTPNSDLRLLENQSIHKISEDSVKSMQIDSTSSCCKTTETASSIVNREEKKGTIVKLLKKKKGHSKKTLLKRKNESSTNVRDESSPDGNVCDVQAFSSDISKECSDTLATHESVENLQHVLSTAEISTSVADTDNETKVEVHNEEMKDKKHIRLSKRKAKMKEISERLKSLAEEYIKTHTD